MSPRRAHWALTIVATLLLAGCAASPRPGDASPMAVSRQTSLPMPWFGAVQAGIDGSVPLAAGRNAALLASNMQLGQRRSPVRYSVDYAVRPGDVISSIGTSQRRAPSQFGRQQLNQNLHLQLPRLGGAPVSVGFSSSVGGQWTTRGYQRSQSERAELSWSPSPATLRLRWGSSGVVNDRSLSMRCDVEGTVRVPLAGESGGRGSNRSGHTLDLAGRDCEVQTRNRRYSGLGAHTANLVYTWRDPEMQTQLLASRIEPVWTGTTLNRPHIEPSYEFGFHHQRSLQEWGVETRMFLRQVGAAEIPQQGPGARMRAGVPDSYWIARTSVQREVANFSISASWLRGDDSLWYVQDLGQRTDRLRLDLDLSSWAERITRLAEPGLQLRWDRQVRTASAGVRRSYSVELNVSLDW